MSVNRLDIAGGIATAALGAAVVFIVRDYNIGTATRMGPGYFPIIIGGLLLLVGLLMIGLSIRSHPIPLPPIAWRPAAAVIAGIAGFITGIWLGGLLPAIVLTLTLASLGDPGTRPRDVLLLTAAVPIAVWLIFIRGLGLPIPFLEVPF